MAIDERIYWIWLSCACTPGSTTFKKLLSSTGSAYEIYALDSSRLSAIITSRSKDYPALTDKSLDRATEIFEYCVNKNIGIVTYGDREYPSILKDIPTPPVLLYYRGKLPDFDREFAVSVVGTRLLSDYGRKNAFMISYDLARSGALIVSGMAIGIDGVAHAGALSAGKPTVAVIGSGIDVLYPTAHGKLAREIVKEGCVLTEFAPGTRPDKFNFPVRNRIISGLSSATLVIEGKERSGALLTARHAREQDRVVYALPGNVGNPNSQLSNLLIRNGAILCTAADDIVRDFEIKSKGRLNPHKLAENAPVNMNEALSYLKVACVTPADDIFKPSRTRKNASETASVEKEPLQKQEIPKVETPDMLGFDKTAIAIYKRIPVGEECAVESLVGDEFSMRDVMKGLLKLEMGRFITMLPGERVRRNF